jgi:hypothetical protein
VGVKIARLGGAILLMSHIPGEGWNQGRLFAVVLDDFVQAGDVRRVIDAFFEKPVKLELGFERGRAAEAETGQPRRIRQSEFRQRRAGNL